MAENEKIQTNNRGVFEKIQTNKMPKNEKIQTNKWIFEVNVKKWLLKFRQRRAGRLAGVLNRGSEYRDGTQTPAVTVSYRQARDGRTVV